MCEQSEDRCHQIPHLARETKVDVSKCHACHANSRVSRVATPTVAAATPPLRPTRATGASPMPYAPCLPHKVKVDVTKYHACHVKARWMSQSATPATPPAAAAIWPLRPTRATGASPMPYLPRLPNKVKVDVTKYHACHATSRGGHPATPAHARHRSQPNAIRATQSEGRCVSKLLCVSMLCNCCV